MTFQETADVYAWKLLHWNGTELVSPFHQTFVWKSGIVRSSCLYGDRKCQCFNENSSHSLTRCGFYGYWSPYITAEKEMNWDVWKLIHPNPRAGFVGRVSIDTGVLARLRISGTVALAKNGCRAKEMEIVTLGLPPAVPSATIHAMFPGVDIWELNTANPAKTFGKLPDSEKFVRKQLNLPTIRKRWRDVFLRR